MLKTTSKVINKSPLYSFEYKGLEISFWKVNAGEGLSKHEHTYEHSVACVLGKLLVTKEEKNKIMDDKTKPIILPANEWHEFEAIEDNTIFINIYPLEK